ncbi:hypothetical protein [Cereibacter azotoformans]|uniref:hypothetical protein n=1 Tax=Cereibacter azotoformans TaxID=43057 RepID=UPI001179AB90|nr:hypothetical protein [Cereibacter azotoformans]
MVGPYRIEACPVPFIGRKPQRNREVATKAANDIRSFRFATIADAVECYLPELTGPMGRNYNPEDRRKDLATYVYEDLKTGPKSLHVFWAISEFTKRRNRQFKAKRKAELIDRILSK